MTCKGKNCTSDGKTPHSSECRFEYAANVASGVKGFTMPSRTTDHIATLERLKREAVGLSREDHEALHAAIALMRGQSWQPIETAPKDGTSILATEIDGEPDVSYFDEGGWVYSWHAYDGYRHWNPTHWQPLPAPPQQEPADEQ